jgi:hypothetical protein
MLTVKNYLIYYANLSVYQRRWLIILLILIFLTTSYYKKFHERIHNVIVAKAQYQASELRLSEQTQLINSAKIFIKQSAQLIKILKSKANDSTLLDQARQAQIFDAQLNVENDHELNFHANTQWPELLRFLSLAADTPQENKINSLEIINHSTARAVELSINVSSVLPIASAIFLTRTIDRIPMKESQWIGILHQEKQALAFLKLPDKTIAALTIGEGFKKSDWQVLAIGRNTITLQDNNTRENIIRVIS